MANTPTIHEDAAAIIHERWMRETSRRITDLVISCAALIREHGDMVQLGNDGIDALSPNQRMNQTQAIFNCVNDVGDKLEALRQLEGLRQLAVEIAKGDDAEEPVRSGYDA